MRQAHSDEQDQIGEQVRLATQLHDRDLRQAEKDKERAAATKAAEEMGIPAAYMELAAAELSARRAAQTGPRTRRAGIIAASVAAAAALGSWVTVHRHAAPPISTPTPLVYDFAAPSQGQWHLNGNPMFFSDSHPDAQASLTFPQEQGHPVALIKINSFYNTQDFAVDLNTNQVPRPLTGYRTVSFRVRGQGLDQIRLFLQSGEERWCSPFLTASGGWHEVRVPINQFLHQRVPQRLNPQDAPYVAPTTIGKISFKLGRDANPVDQHGEVAVDDLRFE